MSEINFSNNKHLSNNNYNNTHDNFIDKYNESKLIFNWVLGIFGVLLFFQMSIILYLIRKDIIFCFNRMFSRFNRQKIVIEMGNLSHEIKENE